MQGHTTGHRSSVLISSHTDTRAWHAAMAVAEPDAVRRPRRLWRFLSGVGGIATVVVGVGLAFGHRDRVVAAVPPLARAFAAVGAPVNIRGLDIRGVRASLVAENGQQTLVVEGNIVSLRQHPEKVPDLRFAVRRPDGRDGYVWTAAADASTIEPTATLHFRAKLVSPPKDGHDVLVRFVEDDGRDRLRFWR